jgi:hypothetical protein
LTISDELNLVPSRSAGLRIPIYRIIDFITKVAFTPIVKPQIQLEASKEKSNGRSRIVSNPKPDPGLGTELSVRFLTASGVVVK